MVQPKLLFYPMGVGVTAFSSTRLGGYGEGHYGEFNINIYCGDSEEAVSRNRKALCQLLGIDDGRLLMPHQTHGTTVAAVDQALLQLSREEQRARLEGVDALMTDVQGVCIGVSTADCIPVLLYDKEHHAACAIHAGWRGTMRRIVRKAVERMTSIYGTRPEELTAQIGPGIHLGSFEVGDEVYDAFASAGFDMKSISKRFPTADEMGEKWHIDLPECNRRQLTAAGIPEASISVSPVCTYEQSAQWFSARRLGINSGRIFTAIILK